MKRITAKCAQLKQENRLGIMAHGVVGYPDRNTSQEFFETLLANGADFLELQIPFSDPIADGTVILKASHEALQNGTRIDDAFTMAQNLREKYPDTPLFFMGYSNTLLSQGISAFVQKAKEYAVDGFIIPDLPPDEPEGAEFLAACQQHDLAAILILSPTSSPERLQYIGNQSSGLCYCVARTGVTGANTDFSHSVQDFLQQCRKATELPLAVGFGISKPEHVAFLKGKADIAVIGSATLRLLNEKGLEAAGSFLAEMAAAGK